MNLVAEVPDWETKKALGPTMSQDLAYRILSMLATFLLRR